MFLFLHISLRTWFPFVVLPPTIIVPLNLIRLVSLWRICKPGTWSPGAIALATSTRFSHQPPARPHSSLHPLRYGTVVSDILGVMLCPNSLAPVLFLVIKMIITVYVMLVSSVVTLDFRSIPHILELQINLIWYTVIFGHLHLLVCRDTNIILLF